MWVYVLMHVVPAETPIVEGLVGIGRQEQSTSGWLAMRSIWGCELHHIPIYISYKERALLTTWLWLRDNDSRAIAIPIGVVIGASIIRITC